MKEREFSELYHRAHAAGMAALLVKVPTPMIVRRDAVQVNGEPALDGDYFVPQGPCGFAWIEVYPGNCSFANWLKKNGKARKKYQGGVSIWVSEGEQSVELKEAYARAFAAVLKAANIPGVKGIYANSRLD